MSDELGERRLSKSTKNKIARAKRGTSQPNISKARKGEPHPKKSWPVVQYNPDTGKKMKTFDGGAKQAGAKLKKRPGDIRDAASGIQKTAYGFKWKYRKKK